MSLMIDENVAAGVTTSNFLEGVNNLDPGTIIEDTAKLGYVVDPATTWLNYFCTIIEDLDPGVVIHKILPQQQTPIDTLASGLFDAATPPAIQGALKQAGLGGSTLYQKLTDVQANLTSQGKFTDIVQRMATSTYKFCLFGYAWRIAYRIPIPGIVTVGGVPAIPIYPQRVKRDSAIVGNYQGSPLYYSLWELWYQVAVPPKQTQLPPPNVAEHIAASDALPSGIQLPFSGPDSLAVPAGAPPPQPLQRNIRGT